MEKLIKLFLYIINLPIYWLSLIIPKNNNIWVFGAWFGEKYADNPKYLFEFINRNSKHIRCIWLSSNKTVICHVKGLGFEVYPTYSIQGYFYSLLAKVIIVSSGKRDVNQFTLTSNALVVNLWHGTALKKIYYDDAKHKSEENFLKRRLFPFLTIKYDLLISTSIEVKEKFSSAFRMSPNKIIISGYPRNDVFSSIGGKARTFNGNNRKRGIYMPTFRDERKEEFFSYLRSNLVDINHHLYNLNLFLLIKLHHQDLNRIKDNDLSLSNIRFIDDNEINWDVYPILSELDFLITDYSSVFFDFLLLDKPIVFFPFDKDEYLTKDREMYYEYDDVTPGPKAYNLEQLKLALTNISKGIDEFKEERKRINHIFNAFEDNNNCERVYKGIKNRIR